MKVSVITGVYFPQDILFRKFLNSCLDTTLDGVEFVIIFDSPEDIASRQILKEYDDKIRQNKNSFIIIENKQNMGIAALYDNFTRSCSGEYVMHLDQDDFFDKDYIETMYNYAHEHGIECLRGYAITHYYGDVDIHYNGEFEENILGVYRGFNVDDWCHIIRRDAALTAESFCEMMSDYSNTPITMLPFQLASFYHYVRHKNNVSVFYDGIDKIDPKRINADYIQQYNEFLDTKKEAQYNKNSSRFDKILTRDPISNTKLMRL